MADPLDVVAAFVGGLVGLPIGVGQKAITKQVKPPRIVFATPDEADGRTEPPSEQRGVHVHTIGEIAWPFIIYVWGRDSSEARDLFSAVWVGLHRTVRGPDWGGYELGNFKLKAGAGTDLGAVLTCPALVRFPLNASVLETVRVNAASMVARAEDPMGETTEIGVP